MRALALGTLAWFSLLVGPLGASGLPVTPNCDCDGRNLSGECNCNKPLDDESARQVLDYVVFLLVRKAGPEMRLDPLPSVRMAAAEELRLEGGDVALATCQGTEIRLGRWLRRPEALVVLAHEYGHAWQDANHPRADRLSERFSEGFASWVADVVARQTGYRRLAEDVRRRSGPVYQEGLVAFRNWERTLGVRRLLELARTWVDFTGEGPLVPAGSPPEGNVD